MRIFRDLQQLPKFTNTVLTIGTYDGVHIGHQKIIGRINRLAEKIGGESLLVTFHPHPRTVVNDNHQVELLSPLEEKFDLLQQYGVDNVVVVPFTRSFSQQSPQEYVHDFLVKHFQPKIIVIGYNHRFGKNRVGDIGLLHEVSTDLGFEVEEISKQQVEDISVSSTKIRKALRAGNVEAAHSFLGHTYFVRGIVVKGKQLGKKIGFPTANVATESEDKLVPNNGVYAVRVKVRDIWYRGMLNIGVRPTVAEGSMEKSIEVNIFEFDEDIYGEKIQIDFVKWIREEQRFAGLEALIEQLNRDRDVCLKVLS